MKKLCILFGILCLLTGCAEKQPIADRLTEDSKQDTESSRLTEKREEEEEGEEEPVQTAASDKPLHTIGITISLPENTSWITDREYKQVDENTIKIEYYDAILEADCFVLAAKGSVLDLPDKEYDKSLDETWEARTISGQNVIVKVQHSTDNKTVLAAWEYEDYKLAVVGNMSGEETDTSAVPKTALYIIQNLE